jgi:hypothetical protein
VASVGLPIARIDEGRIALRLGDAERRIVASLVEELRAELDDPESTAPEGALARLFPSAFPDDAEATASWASLVHADLLEQRRDRVAVVEATVEADELDNEAAGAWLGVLNDLRLALGESLGIEPDDEAAPIDPDDPQAMRRAVFAWLGWVVAAFVDVLDDTLPDVREEAG